MYNKCIVLTTIFTYLHTYLCSSFVIIPKYTQFNTLERPTLNLCKCTLSSFLQILWHFEGKRFGYLISALFGFLIFLPFDISFAKCRLFTVAKSRKSFAQSKTVKPALPIWGRCYDHNFLRFSTIFGENLAFFSKTYVMIKILHNFTLFLVKNANFLPNFWRKYFKNHNIGPRLLQSLKLSEASF
jgi:hypothetical protein